MLIVEHSDNNSKKTTDLRHVNVVFAIVQKLTL